MSIKFEERLEWGKWVTPISLRDKSIHRWCVFPHSFTDDLASALIEEWGLTEKDRILDPFVGAGTSILTAKRWGIPSKGYDLSPFAVLVSQAKIANYKLRTLSKAWDLLWKGINPAKWNGASREYPRLVQDALPGKLLGAFDSIWNEIEKVRCSNIDRRFFQLGLLKTLSKYSRAIPTGGWLSWVGNRKNIRSVKESFEEQILFMFEDVQKDSLPDEMKWSIGIADARRLPDEGKSYSAVICSPPYPNRHDYTRVFGVELMFGFLNWDDTRRLRYQTFESHPEAHPIRPKTPTYNIPGKLGSIFSSIKKSDKDERIKTLLSGYFLDIYLSLREVKRVCKKGARIAYVLGNAQYFGVTIPVDKLTAEIGEQVGLTCDKIITVRYRGNSAQQMERFGRKPSRESVVVFLV